MFIRNNIKYKNGGNNIETNKIYNIDFREGCKYIKEKYLNIMTNRERK